MINDFVAFRMRAYVAIDARTRPIWLRWTSTPASRPRQRGHRPDPGCGADRIPSGCFHGQATA